MREKNVCKSCDGRGAVVVGTNYVTLDMAIDAGDRSLEGGFHSDVMDPCDVCSGTGFIIETDHCKKCWVHIDPINGGGDGYCDKPDCGCHELPTYGDGHYCTHHPDDPAHGDDCYRNPGTD
jgi:RecJ-like exonuclease